MQAQIISEFTTENTEPEPLDIHKACRLGDLNSIQTAICANPEQLDQKDQSLGWTPLYRTVICDNFEAARILLQAGANPDATNSLGETCLHQAADNSQYKMAELLLNSNANSNVQQTDGDTPLHHAAFRGDKKMCHLLLQYKADPNIQNQVFGRTPLHYAVESGSKECMKLLLESNGNPLIRDQSNKTAYDLAGEFKMYELIMEVFDKGSFVLSEDKENISQISDYLSYEISEYTDKENAATIESPVHFSAPILKNVFNTPKSSIQHSSQLPPKFREARISMVRRSGKLAPLYAWLSDIGLEELYEVMVESGYDDVPAMVAQMKSPLPITEEIFREIGIVKPGHRYRLLMKIEEEAGIFTRWTSTKPNALKCCVLTNNTALQLGGMNLRDWLLNIKLEEIYDYFAQAGFEDYAWLISQMHWRKPITDQMLEQDFQILKPGYRNRILSQLHEDYQKASAMFEGGKTTACDLCIIF